jgi:hypothetical protein
LTVIDKEKKFYYKIVDRRNVEVITHPFKEEEEEEEEEKEEPSTMIYNKKNIPDCSFNKLGLYYKTSHCCKLSFLH